MGYEFDIYYRTGASNRVADRLSRKGEEGKDGDKTLQVITRPYWPDFQEIIKEVEKDEGLKKIIEEIKNDPDSHPAYTMENEMLHFKGRLVLSEKSGWIPKILAEFHDSTTGGHSGVEQIWALYSHKTSLYNKEQPKAWNTVLPWAEYWYNTSYQGTAKCTPFETIYGRPPPTLTRFIPGETLVEVVAQDLQTWDEAINQLQHYLTRAQERMVQYANRKRKESIIKEGDW
ncbi:uncharacterized protein LOC124830981, partial [Vigna umbellata]|uniref:uncharacterized protein LOC124830981 n=1 Tax=Vigna umbellata TaxID=87088 RepID=UPI001F5EF518